MKNLTNIPFARIPLLVGLAAFLSVIVAIFSFYLIQKEELKQELQTQLLGIGTLKVDQINVWVEQYYRDGLLLKNSGLLPRHFQEWAASADFPGNMPQPIAAHLSIRKDVMHYREISVVRPNGDLLYSTSEEHQDSVDDDRKYWVDRAVASGEIFFSSIHVEKNRDKGLNLDMVVPLSMPGQKGQPVTLVFLLHIDVEKFLFPLVSSWPTPTETAETLLVTREGSEVLFLNKPRHWTKGGALSLRLRIPQDGKSLVPAIRGILGEKGIMEGVDYRGVPVLAATIPLTRLPWTMVSKMDQNEAYAWLRIQTWVFLLGLVATVLLGSLWWITNIQETIRISMDRLNLSQSIANMGSWDWAPDSDQEIWSQKLFKIFGLKECPVNRLLFQQFIHPEDRERVVLELFDALERTHAFDREYRIVRQDGSERFVQEQGQIFRSRNGKVIRVLGVLTDITERKKVEAFLHTAKTEAEEANQAKELFLANMSHEVRTPLNAIINLSELALQISSTPKVMDYIEKIKNSSEILAGIIQDILDLSKIRSGTLELEHKPFYLEDVLFNLATILGVTNKKKLRVFFRIAERMPRHFRGDPLRLGQVLLNLMNNAIKFTSHGFVLLTVHVEEYRTEQALMHFAVTDTGCGVTEEQKQHIFKPFTQGDSSIARRFGGTGLGLTISQRLVTLMHGRFHVQSEPGLGSTFSFNVVLDVLPDPLANEAERHPLAGVFALVVDDHPLFRKILTEMLTSFGMTVQAVGEEADLHRQLEQWQEEQHPLVMLFWNKENHDALHDLCTRHPPGGSLNYCLFTTDHTEETDLLVQSLKLDMVLAHPFTPAMLRDAILRLISNKLRINPQEKSDPQEEKHPFSGARILVVEDMEINQQVAQELLQEERCVVTLVGDGREAIAYVRRHPCDLIFMDLQMPGMDGLEATRQIRKMPGMENLPIIAMTAYAFADDQQRCLDSGMNDHLSKPINRHLLRKMLRRWLPDREPGQSLPDIPPPDPGGTIPLQMANLPGFDTATGLANVIGNQMLYQILLRKFRRTNQETADKVQSALMAGNNSQAKILVHGVAGVASTLGARSLMQAARELEQALSVHTLPRNEEMMHQFALFQTGMEEALAALRQWDKEGEEGDHSVQPRWPDQKNLAAVHPLLEKLQPLIASQSVVECMHQVEILRYHLAGTQLVTETELLMEQLFKFDLDRAQQTVLHIQEALPKNL